MKARGTLIVLAHCNVAICALVWCSLQWGLFPIRMCFFFGLVIFYEAFQFTILIHFETFYTEPKTSPCVEVVDAHLFMAYC